MHYFWTAREQVPYGVGFSLYHWQHLLWLAGILVVALAAVWYAARLSASRSTRLLRLLAWTSVAMELARDGILLLTGQFYWAYLPLDLCGISIFLELAAVYCSNAWVRECVYCLSLPGACLALLFPNWNKLPMGNYFCIHGFVLHGLLVLVALLLCATGQIHPSVRRLPGCFIGIVLACIPIALVNQSLGTNFFFLAAPSKGSPLVWFAQVFGNHLIGFPILMALVWLGMYGIPWLVRRKKR